MQYGKNYSKNANAKLCDLEDHLKKGRISPVRCTDCRREVNHDENPEDQNQKDQNQKRAAGLNGFFNANVS